MIRYEEIKKEIQLSQMEIQDEIDYYQKKIEEFKKKKENQENIFNAYRRKLDEYVIEEFKKNTEKAWLHFIVNDKTNETSIFFNRIFKNTGLQISSYEKKKVKFILMPDKIINIKKTEKVINALFEMSKRYDIQDLKIQVLNINRPKSNEMYIYKIANNYIFKTEEAKRATLKDENGILFLDKIISYANEKE